MKYRVIISRRADEDRCSAYEWFANHYSIEYARRWIDGITRAMESLSTAPKRCSKAAEDGRFPFDLHELRYGTKKNKHRILFTIEQDCVVILHLRHSAQDDLADEDSIREAK